MGSIDNPLQPLSHRARPPRRRFVARSVDADIKHLRRRSSAPAHHKGTAFVEIYQNCNIFNDGAFDYSTDARSAKTACSYLEHGKPMIFGKDRDKGIRLNGLKPEVVSSAERRHRGRPARPRRDGRGPDLAYMLTRMCYPEFPVPVGVLRRIDRPTHDQLVVGQIDDAITRQGDGDLNKLLLSAARPGPSSG